MSLSLPSRVSVGGARCRFDGSKFTVRLALVALALAMVAGVATPSASAQDVAAPWLSPDRQPDFLSGFRMDGVDPQAADRAVYDVATDRNGFIYVVGSTANPSGGWPAQALCRSNTCRLNKKNV